MSAPGWTWIAPATLLIAACASAPVHYHTLVPAVVAEHSPAPMSPYRTNVRVAIERVAVPAQVDRFELVVRRDDGEVALMENELWIAPLSEEVKNALSLEIPQELGSDESFDLGRGVPAVSIRVEVERFESSFGKYALIEAAWQLRAGRDTRNVMLSCKTYAYERVESGYESLVRGHQRAVALMAHQISASVRLLASGGSWMCPIPAQP